MDPIPKPYANAKALNVYFTSTFTGTVWARFRAIRKSKFHRFVVGTNSIPLLTSHTFGLSGTASPFVLRLAISAFMTSAGLRGGMNVAPSSFQPSLCIFSQNSFTFHRTKSPAALASSFESWPADPSPICMSRSRCFFVSTFKAKRIGNPLGCG